MFKVFLLFSLFLTFGASAQESSMFADDEASQENLLSKYTNARAICARMTDPVALYERGMLLASDDNEDAYLAAADCFMAAATRNHTQAQIELGKMYEYGRGVPQSDIFAYKWYQTAVLLGDKSAVTPRNRLENAMSIDDITMSIPLIQKTLDLLDMYAERQNADLEKKEKELEQQYSKYFNINLSEFDPPADEKKAKSENPLVEALIQAQLQKEAEERQKQAAAEALENMTGGRQRSNRSRQTRQPIEDSVSQGNVEEASPSVSMTGMSTSMGTTSGNPPQENGNF